MPYGTWASLTFLSMLSVMLLPRQFQIAVVENVNETLARELSGMDALDQAAIDYRMIELDGSENKKWAADNTAIVPPPAGWQLYYQVDNIQPSILFQIEQFKSKICSSQFI